MLIAAAVCLSPPALAQQLGQPGVSQLDAVQVTASRIALPVQEVPNSISLISGEELRARGAEDLRSALALLGGVTVAAGGDDGPAGAAPGLLGLREADDFLLLIDGIPAGAAFLPQFATLDLVNVQRIEVQRGMAPVFFGTTAFAGTINLIHYPAGQAQNDVDAAYGSYGSMRLSGAGVLSETGVEQSLSGTLQRSRYSDSRSGLDRAHLLYRLGTELAGGAARLDINTTVQHQRPSSPTPIEDGALATEVPIDFNQNPADAKIDTNRFQLVAAYDRGAWSTNLSVTQQQVHRVQGFLGGDEGADDIDEGDAEGFHQAQNFTELYFDSHMTRRLAESLRASVGFNELYGLAHQRSRAFDYTLSFDGDPPPSSATLPTTDEETLKDLRSLAGLYTQMRWDLSKTVGLLGGLRINRVDERRSGADTDDSADLSSHRTRLSGSLGGDWRVWQDPQADLDDVVLYLSYANSFQPAQLDLGPDDALNPLLPPESARSFELGVKADGFDGRFDADLSAFVVDFDNQPLTTSSGGVPSMVAGGRERYTGFEFETHYHPLPALQLAASYGYNDARYRNFETLIDDDNVQLSGKHLPLTANSVAALGLIYGQAHGPRASLTGNFVGTRYLDSLNTIRTPAYTTLDATLGYAFRRFTVVLRGSNLGDRRDPVLESELGESQFYRLVGRRIDVQLSARLP